MEIESPASPQSIGWTFVQQYYKMLKKAPSNLYRFYNQDSSFVHGGLDVPNCKTSPVFGQKQIRERIQQLNFHDCHANITQVDSQATLGDGVVVQVIGQLSNAGQPMRRFIQTLVLAAQTTNKYYIHNDIFRYEDVISSDEECDNKPVFETEEDQPVPAVNSNVHPEDVKIIPAVDHVNVAPDQLIVAAVEQNLSPVVPTEEDVAIEAPVADQQKLTFNDGNYPELEAQDLGSVPVSLNKAKTYADLLKSGSVSFRNRQRSSPVPIQQTRTVSPVKGEVQIQKQPSARTSPGRNEKNERKRPQNPNFGNRNQLFLGNLPQNATEEELREIFAVFGSILRLRILSKPNNNTNSNGGGRAPPNYGFITYETPTGVQNCLLAKPIFYPKDDKRGIRLNVEEKKVKDRQSNGGDGGGGRPISSDYRSPDKGPRRNGPGGLGAQNKHNSNGNGEGNGGPQGINKIRRNNFNRSGDRPPNQRPNII